MYNSFVSFIYSFWCDCKWDCFVNYLFRLFLDSVFKSSKWENLECTKPPHSVVLSGPQAPRVCRIPLVLWEKNDRNSSLGSPLKRWNLGLRCELFPSPGRNKGFLILCWVAGGKGGTMATEWMLVQTITFILSSPQPGTLSCQCLDSGQTEANPLGSLSAIPQVKMLDVRFSFLFPSQGRSQELEFSFRSPCFDVAGFMLTWGGRASWHVLWFLTRELVYVLLSQSFCRQQEGMGFPIPPFCWRHPLEVTHHNNLTQTTYIPGNIFIKNFADSDGSSNIFIKYVHLSSTENNGWTKESLLQFKRTLCLSTTLVKCWLNLVRKR